MSQQTPFQDKHDVEYGLQSVQRSVGGVLTITSYQLLSHQEKVAFFKKKEVSGIHSFLDKDKDSLQFVISRPTIVNDVHVSIGLLFQQTSKVIEQHRLATNNTKLSGLNDHMVSQFIRILLIVSLQIISDVLTDLTVCAFSLAVDASTHLGVPLLDQQIRVCVKGMLHNLHLIFVPFFEPHTAQNYVKLIKILLDIVSPSWREKVISISSDGENTMTGRHAGVVTLLENECSNPVLRIWCVPHQLDIIVKNATHGVLDEAFYKVAHAFSVHLRAQQILITEMGSKCPKDTMQWVAFDNVLRWLLEHRCRLMIRVADKRPVQVPSTQWWQRQEVSNLMADIVADLDIRSIVDAALINEIDPTTIIQRDGWIVTKDVVVMHICDQGSWARDLYNELFDIEKQQTLQEINIFSLSIVADGLQIQAERDSNNNVRELEAPLKIVDQYRGHLAKHWSADLIDKAESEHRELLAIYACEPNVKVALNKHDKKTFFNEAWDYLKGRFMQLHQLCGGLATAFPNTMFVESDFSIVKWEKNDSRSNLTSLSLASIMHAKQFEQIKMIKHQSFA
ncbi:hypothetical protein BDL97_01G078100 [Sphagnum fallax]|nr:hypothetical protein BDL97_01G078100 [Sphagnum fallax]